MGSDVKFTWFVQQRDTKHSYFETHSKAVAYIRAHAAPIELNTWYILHEGVWHFFTNADPDYRTTGSTAGTWLPYEAMQDYKRVRDSLLPEEEF
jgi:hypothetical protein